MVGVLGQRVDAPREYSPQVLEAIDRSVGRGRIDFGDMAYPQGCDVWHLYELSWLDLQGTPQSRTGVLTIPASSPATVESKSLKLYLNSLNFHAFETEQAAVDCITRDIAAVVTVPVTLDIFSPDGLQPITREPTGTLIDEHRAEPSSADIDRQSLLKVRDTVVDTCYLSHRLRSLCPVTGQPDWATLMVRFKGRDLEPSSLVSYIDSFREHHEFHEQCVERIFADLWRVLSPETLTVVAFYTRRGGIDITPWRSDQPLAAPADRMGRQ